jgi:hypothetical protein
MSKTGGLLPAKKSEPTLAFENAKVLLYGVPKVGKTTLASELAEDVLILACEPGLGGLSTFSIDIDSWEKFREVGAELSQSDKFSVVVIDTVDELHRMCSDHVCRAMKIDHPADAEWGKAYAAIRDEFALRVGKLASLGRGVWFVSHAQEVEIKSRIGTRTKTVPTLNRKAMEFLVGFADFIFLANVVQTEDGEKRLVHTAPAEEYEAGGRYTLPDPLPLKATEIRKAMENATKEAHK